MMHQGKLEEEGTHEELISKREDIMRCIINKSLKITKYNE